LLFCQNIGGLSQTGVATSTIDTCKIRRSDFAAVDRLGGSAGRRALEDLSPLDAGGSSSIGWPGGARPCRMALGDALGRR